MSGKANEKKTFVTTCRTSAQTAASFLLYLRSTGIEPRSKNELLEAGLGLGLETLRTLDPSCVVESLEEALRLLSSLGLETLRNQRTLFEARRSELAAGGSLDKTAAREALEEILQSIPNEGEGGEPC